MAAAGPLSATECGRVRPPVPVWQEEMDKWRHGGGLSSIIARVHRSELLPMAEKLMARQAESKTRRSLEVRLCLLIAS